ncbi:MAG: hypothetical protein ABFD20_09350, partial [Anaerolineales bacterium]
MHSVWRSVLPLACVLLLAACLPEPTPPPGEAADATVSVSVVTETVTSGETESTPAYPAPETPTALTAEPAYPAPES